MKKIRKGVFETNSSSVHSLTICTEEDFNKWRNNKLLYDSDCEEFVKGKELSDYDKRLAEKEYNDNLTPFAKDWNDLSDELKEEYYESYAIKHELYNKGFYTYSDYMYGDWLESYEHHFVTPKGDIMVAFGRYGHD